MVCVYDTGVLTYEAKYVTENGKKYEIMNEIIKNELDAALHSNHYCSTFRM